MKGQAHKAKSHDAHYGVSYYVMDRGPQIGDDAWLLIHDKPAIHCSIEAAYGDGWFQVRDVATGAYRFAAAADLQVVQRVDDPPVG